MVDEHQNSLTNLVLAVGCEQLGYGVLTHICDKLVNITRATASHVMAIDGS